MDHCRNKASAACYFSHSLPLVRARQRSQHVRTSAAWSDSMSTSSTAHVRNAMPSCSWRARGRTMSSWWRQSKRNEQQARLVHMAVVLIDHGEVHGCRRIHPPEPIRGQRAAGATPQDHYPLCHHHKATAIGGEPVGPKVPIRAARGPPARSHSIANGSSCCRRPWEEGAKVPNRKGRHALAWDRAAWSTAAMWQTDESTRRQKFRWFEPSVAAPRQACRFVLDTPRGLARERRQRPRGAGDQRVGDQRRLSRVNQIPGRRCADPPRHCAD